MYTIHEYEFNNTGVFERRPDGSFLRVFAIDPASSMTAWEFLGTHAFIGAQGDTMMTLTVRVEEVRR
jgi:hypothetical protein